MKKCVYIDTTIISYLIDDRESLKTFSDITKEWWKTQRKNFKLFLSAETIAELQFGNYPKKDEAIKLSKSIRRLERNLEVEKIAEIYVGNFLMPKDLLGDAIHLAYASYYKIDFLLTWNCKHLANANKKQHIRFLNNKLNIFTPEIITPLELFTEEKQ
jgi:predicted nucleic acid-binding protein